MWRRWARLQHALSQVADGATLTAAAHGSGFADSAHLTRACRAMFGITPSQAITALRQVQRICSSRPTGAWTRLVVMETLLAATVRYGYAPVMLLGINGAAIWLAGSGASKAWMLGLLGAAITVSFTAERLLPYEPDWNHTAGDAGRDIAHSAVNETLILATVAAIPALAALAPAFDVWPAQWPFALQVMAAILAADAGITLVHLASHKIGLLWRFHAVHHSVKRFYGLNGLMKHPVHQTIEMTAGVAPLLILGLPSSVAAALAVTVAVQLMLQHSNADYRVGPLKHVLALNEGHRFHHLKWAGIGDVNFGLFTLVWDHLLGTYSYNHARRFTSDQLGMSAKPNYPIAYLPQLAEPFRASGACQSEPDWPPSPSSLGLVSHRRVHQPDGVERYEGQ